MEKDTTADFLKNALLGVLKRWRQDDEGDLVTDQGESATCVVHALTKAAKQSLSKQRLKSSIEEEGQLGYKIYISIFADTL